MKQQIMSESTVLQQGGLTACSVQVLAGGGSEQCPFIIWPGSWGGPVGRLRDVMCVALLELENAQLEKGLLVLLMERGFVKI